MKLRTLSAAALIALFAGGNVALAAVDNPTPHDTTGEVTVIDGIIEPETGVTDPEDPDNKLPENPNVVPNPGATGSLEISHAPALTFADIETSTSAQQKTANPFVFNINGVDVKRGPLLQFGDLRTAAHGYTVNVKMLKQFEQGAEQLGGSTITFTNAYFANSGTSAIKPDFEPSVIIGEDGENQKVASVGNIEKAGKGMWAVEFGSNAEFPAGSLDTTGSSVILDVPANTASTMSGGKYTATMQWSIEAAP